jgi:hypothetical protein
MIFKNIWIKFFLWHMAVLYIIAVITGNIEVIKNHIAIQPLWLTIAIANVGFRLRILTIRDDGGNEDDETRVCISYAVVPALFYNALVYVFFQNENVWIKIYFVWLVGFKLMFIRRPQNDEFITKNILDILVYFFALLVVQICFQLVANRNFQKGSLGEEWSVAISSLILPLLFYSTFAVLSDSQSNER